MRPTHRLPLPAHQDVEQQCSPELPADGLFAVAEEVADLEVLMIISDMRGCTQL